jgi:BRCA1-associated protein
MAVSEFFSFLGCYMASVVTLRMVRREDVGTSLCMAILDFPDHGTAQRFIADYNGKPYSTLEPDIICRTVLVTHLELHEMDNPTKALDTPAGHTELPTCPVCLERLDQHISGVVTTVRLAPPV